MATARINSIGLFIDGGYYMKINEGLAKIGAGKVNLYNLIGYVQLAIAKRFDLDPTSCYVTESHFYQGRFRADDTTDAELYDDRDFEDRLIYNDVVFHYKHIGVLADGGHREKGIDVWYALETYELAMFRDFDFVVLITGDADHEMLARKIKALKKQVVLLTWNFADPDSTSPALKEECTFHIDLAELAKAYDFRNKLTGKKLTYKELCADDKIPFMKP